MSFSFIGQHNCFNSPTFAFFNCSKGVFIYYLGGWGESRGVCEKYSDATVNTAANSVPGKNVEVLGGCTKHFGPFSGDGLWKLPIQCQEDCKQFLEFRPIPLPPITNEQSLKDNVRKNIQANELAINYNTERSTMNLHNT